MPGRMNARRVQQPDPTSAISVEKFGIMSTVKPVTTTSSVLIAHCTVRGGGCEGGVGRVGRGTHSCDVAVFGLVRILHCHSLNDLGNWKHHYCRSKTLAK